MAVMARVHRAHHANVIDDLRNMRQQLGNLGATAAAFTELPGRAEELFVGPVDETVGDVAAVFFAVALG